ncbi:hypothetical protein EV715DRAFT_295611 [Schizophyllum commune]
MVNAASFPTDGLELLSSAASELLAQPRVQEPAESIRAPLQDISATNGATKRPPSPTALDSARPSIRPRRTCTIPREPTKEPAAPRTPAASTKSKGKRGRPSLSKATPAKRAQAGRPPKDKVIGAPAVVAAPSPDVPSQASVAPATRRKQTAPKKKADKTRAAAPIDPPIATTTPPRSPHQPAPAAVPPPPKPRKRTSRKQTQDTPVVPGSNSGVASAAAIDNSAPPAPPAGPRLRFIPIDPALYERTPPPGAAAGVASPTPQLSSPMPAVVTGPADSEVTPTGGRRTYSDQDKSVLTEHMLGEDSDARFNKLLVSRNKIWKKVHKELNGRLPSGPVTPQQLGSLYTTLESTFKELYAFRKFTGRGADADDYDWDNEEQVAAHLRNSKNKGCPVENLTAAQCVAFIRNGWYALFESRFHSNPKFARQCERSSASPLSDLDMSDGSESEAGSDDGDEAIIITTPVRPPSANASRFPKAAPPSASKAGEKPKSASRRGRPRKEMKDETKMDLNGLNAYFESKAKSEEQLVDLRERSFQSAEREKVVKMAQKIIADTNAGISQFSFEVIDKANRVITDYLSQMF